MQGGLAGQAIFEAVQQQLQAQGYIPRGGQMVDATIVRAPIQHLDKEEKALVRQGAVPREWGAKKTRHKDCEARWTKKHGKSFYGYKLHTNVDVRYKLIRRYKVTAANMDDGQTLSSVVDTANTAARLYADRGYDRRTSRELLAEHGWRDGIARRALPAEKLGQRAEARNRAINRIRARVEHVYAGLRQLGGKTVRSIGLARNELALALKCAVYNVKRLVWVSTNVPAF